jgi:hypothetical protein
MLHSVAVENKKIQGHKRRGRMDVALPDYPPRTYKEFANVEDPAGQVRA